MTRPLCSICKGTGKESVPKFSTPSEYHIQTCHHCHGRKTLIVNVDIYDVIEWLQKRDKKLAAKVEEKWGIALSPRICAYCNKPAEGHYAIHRDGFGIGPEVDLCDICGGEPLPTEAAIWSEIGQATECIQCEEEIRSGDERRGSFHAWCLEVQPKPKEKSHGKSRKS